MFRRAPLSIIMSFSLHTQQWWWGEELSETCIVLFQNKFWEISASSWLYYKNILNQLMVLVVSHFIHFTYKLFCFQFNENRALKLDWNFISFDYLFFFIYLFSCTRCNIWWSEKNGLDILLVSRCRCCWI